MTHSVIWISTTGLTNRASSHLHQVAVVNHFYVTTPTLSYGNSKQQQIVGSTWFHCYIKQCWHVVNDTVGQVPWWGYNMAETSSPVWYLQAVLVRFLLIELYMTSDIYIYLYLSIFNRQHCEQKMSNKVSIALHTLKGPLTLFLLFYYL